MAATAEPSKNARPRPAAGANPNECQEERPRAFRRDGKARRSGEAVRHRRFTPR
jgi:hypothetical protein